MSTQKGNTKKKPQKYQNSTAFKNNLHDTSKKIKEINNIEFHGLCDRCKDVLEWKVKFKKYKPLTVPKKCVKCLEKKVKIAYYIVCQDCCMKHKICSKCSQTCEDVSFGETEVERIRKEQEFQNELKSLSERQRRKFLRLLDKGVFTKENLVDGSELVDKAINDNDGDDDDDFDDLDEQMNACKEKELSKNQNGSKIDSNLDDDNFDEDDDDDENYEDMSDFTDEEPTYK